MQEIFVIKATPPETIKAIKIRAEELKERWDGKLSKMNQMEAVRLIADAAKAGLVDVEAMKHPKSRLFVGSGSGSIGHGTNWLPHTAEHVRSKAQRALNILNNPSQGYKAPVKPMYGSLATTKLDS